MLAVSTARRNSPRVKEHQDKANNMKTRLSTLVIVLCSVANYSYAQTTAGSDQFGSSPRSASKQPPPSGIFDPLGLISPSQQGQLTTLGKGFSFTEGPAVDRHGNVFYTDQPNDLSLIHISEPTRLLSI